MTKLLFRPIPGSEEELFVANKYFEIAKFRTQCKNEKVICRYSALPHYQELEQDLLNLGCSLINTVTQHLWVANFEYYEVLKEFTPQTWFQDNFYRCDYDGPFVVKGMTNSHKFNWNTKMFAPTKRDAIKIGGELSSDGFIGTQSIIYRKYIPLKTLEIGANGLPFSNEWRLFFLGSKLLSYGYYWSIAEKILPKNDFPREALNLAHTIANIAKDFCNFFVLDLAETQTGEWILIEVNDGQQAGPSECDLTELYSSLKQAASD